NRRRCDHPHGAMPSRRRGRCQRGRPPCHSRAMATRIDLFDRRAVRRQRERAAATLPAHDFLFREAASRLVERLDEVRRSFPMALDLGGHGGVLAAALQGRGRIATLVETDLSLALARRANGLAVVADEEALPFAPGAFDLALSCLSLHWVND